MCQLHILAAGDIPDKLCDMTLLQPVKLPSSPVSQHGETVLLTGATRGVGAALAKQVVEAGARLIIAGRDPERRQETLSKLAPLAHMPIEQVHLDLADLETVKEAVRMLHRMTDRLDIVFANAAILYTGKTRQFTKQGLELTIGVNHFGNAALLSGLRNLICARKKAQVILVGSEAHRRAGGFPLNDLNGEKAFDGLRAYNRSKLANILFAQRLSSSLKRCGTLVRVAHPGGVRTGMIEETTRHKPILKALFWLLQSQLLSPETAARGLMQVAQDKTTPSGSYFEIGKPAQPSPLAHNRKLQDGLWIETRNRLLEYGFAAFD